MLIATTFFYYLKIEGDIVGILAKLSYQRRRFDALRVIIRATNQKKTKNVKNYYENYLVT